MQESPDFAKNGPIEEVQSSLEKTGLSHDKSKGEDHSMSPMDKRNELSINLAGDISDIIADNLYPQGKAQQTTPAFKNKEVINFYEGATEDMSMLRDIMSNRSVNEDVNLLNQSQETTRMNRRDMPKITPVSPLKLKNQSNTQDKSTAVGA